MKILKRTAFVLVLFLSLGSAACTTAFQPRIDASRKMEATGAYSLALLPLEDKRENKKTDKIYETRPDRELSKLLQHRLLTCGVFKSVAVVSGDRSQAAREADYTLTPTLTKLEMVLNDEEGYNGKMAVMGALTGGLGTVIYGSIVSEDFHGFSDMKIRLTENKSGKALLDKEYKGYVSEHKKLVSDGVESRAALVGEAVEEMLEKIIKDVKAAVSSSASTAKTNESGKETL